MSKVVDVALKYVGQKEKINNSGFNDYEFEDRMEKVGWKQGQAWCAYFTELVYKEAFPERFNELDKLFSGGAVATYNNFFNSPNFICNDKPEPGAIVIWQYYKNSVPHWSGHAGIVKEVFEKEFSTIEGNTNSEGGREGIEVSEKLRMIDFRKKQQGLVLKGFIKIKQP